MSKRLIEVRIASFTPKGITLTVMDYLTGMQVSMEEMTLDQIIAVDEWKIISAYHPLESEIPSVVMENPRVEVDRLKAMKAEIQKLREESWSTGDRTRCDEINARLRVLENQQRVQYMIVQTMLYAMLGDRDPSNI